MILEAEGNGYTDQAWINFDSQAQAGMDTQFDLAKRISQSNPELPQIYTITADDIHLALNGLPETETISVGFNSYTSGVYTIRAAESMENTEIILEDLVTGELTSLLESDYSFTWEAGSESSRFVLHFSPLSTPGIEAGVLNVYSSAGTLYVNVPENTEGTIAVYTLTGQQVAMAEFKGALNTFRLKGETLYIVKLTTETSTLTKKVFVK